MRIEFTLLNTAVISKAVLNMDYDDAFVAYLNGVEIARSNIGIRGDHPAFNQASTGHHEATMYQGGSPEYFYLTRQQISDVLMPGEITSIYIGSDDHAQSEDILPHAFPNPFNSLSKII